MPAAGAEGGFVWQTRSCAGQPWYAPIVFMRRRRRRELTTYHHHSQCLPWTGYPAPTKSSVAEDACVKRGCASARRRMQFCAVIGGH